MRHLMDSIFDTWAYHTSTKEERARLLYGIILLTGIAYTLFITVSAVSTNGVGDRPAAVDPMWPVRVLLFDSLLALSYLATRRGHLRFGAISFLVLFYVALILNSAFQNRFSDGSSGILLASFVLLGGLLEDEPGAAVALVIGLLTVAFGMASRGATPL
ncbi:MAG TPA: hypothetical protein VMT34_02520, partial [Aggregatilineales bacterium]|nr:hypothetical protein [Aggregatilineales bacterium]